MAHEADWQLIRNRFHIYGNPISVERIERIYDLLDLQPGARVLDVGCGKGEDLIRLVEPSGCERDQAGAARSWTGVCAKSWTQRWR